MVLELQRKMMKTGMEWTEKSLETLYKDKTFLQLSSVGLNMNMWMQKTYGKGLGWLFKNMNIPDEGNLTALHEDLHKLEKQNHAYESRIQSLENTIDDLHQKLKIAEAKAPKKAAPQKEIKARSGIRRKTTDTVA